jgi:hypothetical protein
MAGVPEKGRMPPGIERRAARRVSSARRDARAAEVAGGYNTAAADSDDELLRGLLEIFYRRMLPVSSGWMISGSVAGV